MRKKKVLQASALHTQKLLFLLLLFNLEKKNFLLLFAVENETRCYGEIGCLNITRDWYHLIHRPFNVFPLPRTVINTRFILYTEKNPTDGQLIAADDPETIKRSHFNPKWPTKFIIHGFIDTPLSNWVSEMRDELIHRGELNVIGELKMAADDVIFLKSFLFCI